MLTLLLCCFKPLSSVVSAPQSVFAVFEQQHEPEYFLICVLPLHTFELSQNSADPGYDRIHIFSFIKRSEDETVHVIVNFSEHRIQLDTSVFNCFEKAPTDLLTGTEYPYAPLMVEPYQMFCLYTKN